MKVNPEQIIHIAFQIRQLEILRNGAKRPKEKQAMTLELRRLKGEIDPLLMAFVDEKKAGPKPAKNDIDSDLGPKEIVDAMHAYAKMKISQEEVVSSLIAGPVSVAGSDQGVMYVMHFERNHRPPTS